MAAGSGQGDHGDGWGSAVVDDGGPWPAGADGGWSRHGTTTTAPPVGRSRRRGFRRWRWGVGLLLGGSIFLLVAGALFLCTLPGVGDAEARVAARLAAHGGIALAPPVPETLARAVVASEDRRFYQHHGVDPRALLRATWATLHGHPEGGDTITEQLVQVLYGVHGRSPLARLRVLGLALKLERRYTKAQILAMYLNTVSFGDGLWGVTQASQAYFAKAPAALDWAEASLLVGVLPAPTWYEPRHHFAAAQQRQRQVLHALVHTGMLTPDQAATAAAERLSLAP